MTATDAYAHEYGRDPIQVLMKTPLAILFACYATIAERHQVDLGGLSYADRDVALALEQARRQSQISNLKSEISSHGC
ncbi:MAG: hypothetical protein NTY01_08455 [Verrucomicrobia bacterium]|nr:hypothetical protein [Verrucomicrobiota bacterium]